MMELRSVPREEAEAHVAAGGGAFFLLDRTGDSKTVWDPTRPAEVEAAQAQFNKLVTCPAPGEKPYSAFRATADGEKSSQKMTKFDPKAGAVILVPPMAGG